MANIQNGSVSCYQPLHRLPCCVCTPGFLLGVDIPHLTHTLLFANLHIYAHNCAHLLLPFPCLQVDRGTSESPKKRPSRAAKSAVSNPFPMPFVFSPHTCTPQKKVSRLSAALDPHLALFFWLSINIYAPLPLQPAIPAPAGPKLPHYALLVSHLSPFLRSIPTPFAVSLLFQRRRPNLTLKTLLPQLTIVAIQTMKVIQLKPQRQR